LLEPEDNATFDANTRVTFAWSASTQPLPDGYGYEAAFWLAGEGNPEGGLAPVGASTFTTISVDPSNTERNIIPRNRELRWAVFFVRLAPNYKRIQQISEVRTVRFNSDNGGNTPPGNPTAPPR